MVIVNGSHFVFDKKEIYYEDVLNLLGLTSRAYSVVFTKSRNGEKGMLMSGQSTTVVDGMRINCDMTNNA
jgi:hypothetical protein